MLRAALSVVTGRDEQGEVIFNVSERVQQFHKLVSSLIFINLGLTGLEHSKFIAHCGGSRLARELGLDAHPGGFVLRLDQFQSVQCRKVVLAARRLVLRLLFRFVTSTAKIG